MISASVQTANDATLPSWPLCLLLVAVALILTACIAAPDIAEHWRRARRFTDTLPDPTVPRRLDDRLPTRQEHAK